MNDYYNKLMTKKAKESGFKFITFQTYPLSVLWGCMNIIVFINTICIIIAICFSMTIINIIVIGFMVGFSVHQVHIFITKVNVCNFSKNCWHEEKSFWELETK